MVRVSKDKLKDKKQELKHSLPDVNEKKILASFLAHLQKNPDFLQCDFLLYMVIVMPQVGTF